jgi:tRNA pseudouridine55 synthase
VRHGILLVDKPSGPTSHDIVEMARHALGIRQIGHMGTLDPLATGLLLLGIGEGTKLQPFLAELDKTYECVARLGARSSTYDAMGTIETVAEPAGLERTVIEEAVGRFRGTIEQAPPPFSAVKVAGRPLYSYARRGEKVESRPRRVRVFSIDIVAWKAPDLELRMRVSSGTYVRSIVHEIGESLRVGAYVSQLRRTAVGLFDVADAVTLATGVTTPDDWEKGWRSLAEALNHWDWVRVPEALAGAAQNGATIGATGLATSRSPFEADRLYRLLDGGGDRLLAVARCLVSRGAAAVQGPGGGRGEFILKPVRVFHDE